MASALLAAGPRLEGFRKACADAGLSPDDTPILRGEGQAESGELAATHLAPLTSTDLDDSAIADARGWGSLAGCGPHR